MNGLCSHERLELALAGTLNTDEESSLHLHLEDCELCAAEMERLSGGEQASREIAELLVHDELDDALPLREECSTADFVVDHLEPSDDPAVLGRLGGYDVLDIIGRGGMGVVLKGFDRELKRFVAIKALAPHLAHSPLARKRFAREAQAAAAVVNLHVIAIHQVQPNGQLPFLVMPLLTGESLAQRIKRRGTLELKAILRIGMQAAEGLAAAHGQGLIHRDVKPANILLEKGVERAVLTDFGLARAADDVSMTRQGVVAGTPEYMSPEQARGEALDGRSDLFSLGCVLYEMATGGSPFRTDSTMATLRRIVDEQPAAMASLVPELPPWFCRIVERLLSKDPAQRFASASEVSQLLEQCLSHLQQPTSVPLPASLVPHAKGRVSIFNLPLKKVIAIAMLGIFGLYLLGMALMNAPEPHIASKQPAEEKAHPGATAKLGSDIEIKLLGVSYQPSEDKPWWTPEGDALPGDPLASRWKSGPMQVYDEGEHRELTFEITGAKNDVHAAVDFAPGDKLGMWSTFWNIQDDEQTKKKLTLLRSVSAGFPKGEKQRDVLVRLAVAPWHPYQVIDLKREKPLPEEKPEEKGEDGTVQLRRVHERTDGTTQIDLIFPAKFELRAYHEVIAQDIDGNEVKLHGITVADADARGLIFRCPQDRLAMVGVRFRWYTHEVTFGDVSLHPNHATQVKAKVTELEPPPARSVAILPNGAMVELIGVSFHPSEGNMWWQASGGMLKQRPQIKGISIQKEDPNQDEMRELAVQIRGIPQDYAIRAESNGGQCAGNVSWENDVLTGIYLAGRSSAGTARLRVGLTTEPLGPGLRIFACAGRESIKSLPDVLQPFYHLFQPLRVEKKDDRLELVTKPTDPLSRLADWQIVAVDKAGQSHGQKSSRSFEDRVAFEFDLRQEELDHFEFRLRPYRYWVTFDSVSRHPGKKTDVTVQVSFEPITIRNDTSKQSTDTTQTAPADDTATKHPPIESRSVINAARQASLRSERDKHPPLEFRIAASKADRDAEGIAWFPIVEPRIPAPAEKSGANLPIEEKVEEKWRGMLWDKVEHTLLSDGTWRVVKCLVVRSAQSTDLVPSFDIQIKLDAVGGALLHRLTATHLNQSLAIVVEGTIVAAPIIRSEIGEDFVITGNFSKAAAEKLAATIRKPDPRKRATFGLRFADAKTSLAALKDEAARRKLRGFEATVDPRQNTIIITAADADTLEALREILDRLETAVGEPKPESNPKSKLAGVWIAEKVTSSDEVVPKEKFPFELHFENDKQIFRFVAPSLGKDRVHEIVVDETKSPATIDIRSTDPRRKETVYAIFKLEGDRLWIHSFRDSDGQPSEKRPTTFDSSKEERSELLVLTRKPAPQK